MKARSWQGVERTEQQTFMLSKELCGLQGGAHIINLSSAKAVKVAPLGVCNFTRHTSS